MKNRSVFLRVFIVGVLVANAAWARNPVLDLIVEEARDARASGVIPFVVADLDETVIDSMPRRWAAYRGAHARFCGLENEVNGAFSARRLLCESVSGLNLEEMYALPNRYDGHALARVIGIDPETQDWGTFVALVLEEYLSGRYENLDQPVAGANAYLRELRSAGAEVFFVSSRFEDAQGASTLASLRSFEMLGKPEQVILRPRGMTSLAFKRMAFERIRHEVERQKSRVVGVFENEPENIQAMLSSFPEARGIFVDGAFIVPGPVPERVTHIRNYR